GSFSPDCPHPPSHLQAPSEPCNRGRALSRSRRHHPRIVLPADGAPPVAKIAGFRFLSTTAGSDRGSRATIRRREPGELARRVWAGLLGRLECEAGTSLREAELVGFGNASPENAWPSSTNSWSSWTTTSPWP